MGIKQFFLGDDAPIEPAGMSSDDKAIEASFQSGQGIDPDENLWSSLSSASSTTRRKNLSSIQQDQMIRLAYQFYKSNPLAKRAIQITAEYAIGDGIQYDAESPQIRQILNEHWSDTVNNWPLYQYERTRDLGLTGEQMIPAVSNPHNGHVQLANIDPDLIETIVEDTINPFKTYGIILKKLRGESYRRCYKIIDVADVTTKDGLHGRLVGLPETDEEMKEFGFPFKRGDVVETKRFNTRLKAQWFGACFFFKVNSPMGANRGFSDLLAGLDWLDAHDQFLFSQVEKGIESAKYIWDITLTGANKQKITEFLLDQRSHKPGLRVAHNEGVSYQVLTPNLHMEDATAMASAVKNNILSGVGLPPIWFSESMTSRASAPEQTEPAYKSIRMRQRYVAFMMSRIFQYQIDESIRHGAIKMDRRMGDESQRESEAFFIKLPDVSAKDTRALGITINNIATALQTALSNELVDKARAKVVFNRFLDMTGVDTWATEQTNPPTSQSGDTKELTNVFMKVREGNMNIIDGNQFNYGESSFYMFNHQVLEESKNGKVMSPAVS